MKHVVEKAASFLLGKAGYKLQRSKKKALLVSKENDLTRGKVIEFIGPSGVGKSFLLGKAWPCFEHRWTKRAHVSKSLDDHLMPESKVHWAILQAKVQKLADGSYNSYQRAKLLQYFSIVIVQDLELRQQFTNCGIFLDEGIFHNFSRELLALDDADFASVAKGRAIVALFPEDPETVHSRRRARFEATGKLVTNQSGLNRREQLRSIEGSIAQYEKVLARVKAANVPCLRLVAEAPVEESLALLKEFERSLVGAEG